MSQVCVFALYSLMVICLTEIPSPCSVVTSTASRLSDHNVCNIVVIVKHYVRVCVALCVGVNVTIV